MPSEQLRHTFAEKSLSLSFEFHRCSAREGHEGVKRPRTGQGHDHCAVHVGRPRVETWRAQHVEEVLQL